MGPRQPVQNVHQGAIRTTSVPSHAWLARLAKPLWTKPLVIVPLLLHALLDTPGLMEDLSLRA